PACAEEVVCVSKGKPVTVFSPVVESSPYCIKRGYTKDKLTDGLTTTLAYPGGMWWDSSAITPDPWKYKVFDYEIDLGGYYDLSQVKMHWGRFGATVADTPDNPNWHGKPYIRGWRLMYLDIKGQWKTATDYPGTTSIPGEEITQRNLFNITASKLRITAWGYHWSGVYELEAFGTPHIAGALIGPEGGEITSTNGKVKLIVPQGALAETTKITLSSIDTGSLEGSEPKNTSLLSVVECKPSGLNFIKPATIIYELSEAEVPGTAVQLGFYDSVQGKIITTGQTSSVETDSYHVSFKLSSFPSLSKPGRIKFKRTLALSSESSAYAALKSLDSVSSAPIGGGVKIPLPDMFTGSFSHSIPITVSPGRKGMQPSLALIYRSGNPNSWVGIGFNLNPGYIVRSTRLGLPSYTDSQDTFYFVNDAGTTELINLTDKLYQAKVESGFTKFFKEADDSWRAIGKDGSVLIFGQSSASKETSPKGTYSWYLTKATDTNGNYISYSYDNEEGKAYLFRIDYTGSDSGTSPRNSVEFFLESRDDVTSSYMSGAKISTKKRLKEIQAKANGGLTWRYELEYVYSPDTNRSVLKSVTQYGNDDKSLPKQTFIYQTAK
ncbi:MAG: SpvB/TcaC N-terminal domain-containing protein, partial [Candidatus Omnitrophota bacterium]